MLHTRTAIAYQEGVAAVLPAIVGVDRALDEVGDQPARMATETAIDEVLMDSFPASDPPSWNPGIIRPHPADGFGTDAVTTPNGRERQCVADVNNVSVSTNEGRTFLHVLVSILGGAGIVLLLGVAVLLVGLPIALVVRGLLEAIGWLFGVAVY